MRKPVYSTRFKKEYKLMQKRGLNITKIHDIITRLVKEIPLLPQSKDHALNGDYLGYRECHIEPDWLLIYKIEGDDLILVRTGSHSDLF
jgi:mRNA interferase YafQ